MHQKAARQYADASFKGTHMDVHLEHLYILAGQHDRCEGKDCRIVASKYLKHMQQVSSHRPDVETGKSDMSLDHAAAKPHERLSATLADDLAGVNALIRDRMASEHAPRIPEVTAHLVEAGGKRVRPMLTLACARLCGYQGNDHVKLAATVEFIHTATLLHDDVVDESQKRRGRPTANLLWDNKSSVLVGDYLFARAFQLMVEPGSLRVLSILSNAAATIAEGEVLQLSAAMNINTSEATYLQVIRGKTAALFEAACEVGGVISDSDESVVRALAAYGDGLGVAFQMADDLLDWGGVDAASAGTLDKNIGDDFRERKLTLPVIRAIAAADADQRAFWDRTIAKGDQRDGDLEEALRLLTLHNTLAQTRDEANAHVARAKEALTDLPDDPIRDMLADLADYVVARLN